MGAMSIKRTRSFARLQFTMCARDVPALKRLRHAESVQISQINGLRPKPRPAPPAGARLFAVKARLVTQVEGQRSGLQQYEDRVIVLVAASEKAAVARVTRLMKSEESPMMLRSGHFVRNQLEAVLEVIECLDAAGFRYPLRGLNRQGTEVWFDFRRRRLNKRHEWHPV